MLHNLITQGLSPAFGTDLEIAGLFVARIATGLFFVFSGYHKLFNAARHKTLLATLKDCGVSFLPVMQWFVPLVEFCGGLGVTFGFLTPLSALGLICICAVASCTDGKKHVRSWHPIDKADAVDDVLYQPEVLYIVLLLQFVLNGAGHFAIDAWL